MRNSIKSLKNYFQLIVTAVTCFVMGLVKDKECACECRSESCETKRAGFLSKIWRSLGMCFVYETPKAKLISEYIVKDKDSKKTGTDQHAGEKKNARKNKIIYWNEPRIQNRINKSLYFNTG